MGEQTKHLQKLAYMVLNSKQNIMHHKSPLESCDVRVCEARTPNAKTRQLPSAGTVTPPGKAQLRIRTNSINGTRNIFIVFYDAMAPRNADKMQDRLQSTCNSKKKTTGMSSNKFQFLTFFFYFYWTECKFIEMNFKFYLF